MLIWALPLRAEDRDAEIDQLVDLLRFDETIAIMHEEGLRYGAEVAVDMLPEADMASWQSTVARIYDEEKMLSLITADFRQELQSAELSPMIAYFAGEDGQQVIELELAARQTFLDPEAQDAAIEKFQALKEQEDPLAEQVEVIMSDSDLIEFNVMGSLNASLMFYRGLRDGGVYDVTEEEMLSDVWAQEEDTRRESHEWLGGFLAMAYEPLEPAQLEDYAAFFRSPEGRELNRAIFASFDRMYEELSYLIGLAVADHMTTEPI